MRTKLIKILTCVSMLTLSNLSLANEYVTYRTETNENIKIEKDKYNEYKKKYSNFLNDLSSCQQSKFEYNNIVHGKKSTYIINGVTGNGKCSVSFNNNEVMQYICNLGKQNTKRLIDVRMQNLKEVKELFTFSEEENLILESSCEIIFLKKPLDVLSEDEKNELYDKHPHLKTLNIFTK